MFKKLIYQGLTSTISHRVISADLRRKLRTVKLFYRFLAYNPKVAPLNKALSISTTEIGNF